MKSSGSGETTVVQNRKARFNYVILDRVEAGLVLEGAEVKSVRAGKVSIKESYATIQDGEAFIVNMDITPYENRGFVEVDRRRRRKLLLRRQEIRRLTVKVRERGYTLIPIRVYFIRGVAKVELGLARGKSFQDKRENIKKREARRDVDRAIADRRRRHRR